MLVRTARYTLVWSLILAMLFAQGLRMCIPAVNDGHHGPIHLESLLTATADQHESDSDTDTDLALAGILKIFSLSLAFCALLVFIALPAAPYRIGLLLTSDEVRFHPPPRIGFSPPLRAPPR
ncbi:MAG: hypothetical protein HY942_07945 [Gammaproteobacteria bacterium]|nr:hypothetical protein [Gammaproteobacteria bacterium]